MKKLHGCNFSEKNDCPVPHKCVTLEILYDTSVTNDKDDVENIYYGLCETSFMERYHSQLKRRKTFLFHLDIKERQYASSIKWKLYLLFAVNP